MKLAVSNIGWEAKDDVLVYTWMRELDFCGLEIAPTRVITEHPYEHLERVQEWKEDIENTYGFTVPSMQSIWFGRQEKIFGSKEERDSLIQYTQKAIDFAAWIGCGNIVFGCPRNRAIPEGMEWDAAMELAISFFRKIGEYAYSKGTVIGMEANPPIYNTNFMNDTESTLALIEKVDSKGFRLNLDVGTMVHNGEDVSILKNRVKWINHVHISEPYLAPIQAREIHIDLKQCLQNENYQGYVSVEMGKQEDVSMMHRALMYVKEVYR